MANFVHHEPCPKCGSRDNLARYDDGSAFCFGCRYYESANIKYIVESSHTTKEERDIRSEEQAWNAHFSPECVGWLGKYEINVSTALKRGFLWHPQRQQLVFPFRNEDGKVIAYQVRNFSPKATTRYFTQGDINSLTPIYVKNSEKRTDTLVLVEDVISAVKCAEYLDAMPCLGSAIPPDKLKRLVKLYGRFVVWLDSNMMKNAMKMCERLDYMGAFISLVHTPLDPKEYSYTELQKTLSRYQESTV